MSKDKKTPILVPGANCACLIDQEGFLVIADIDLGSECKIKDCPEQADSVVCSYTDTGLPIAIKVCTSHAEDLMNYRLAESGVEQFYTITKVEAEDSEEEDLFTSIATTNKKLLN